MHPKMNPTKTLEPEAAALKGKTILVYSSDRGFLDYYRSLSFHLGFTPVTATTPETAWAILRLLVLTLVVADADEGLERCREVMQYAREMQHHAPIVIVSKKLNQNFRRQAEALGAAEYLRHPMPPDEMVHALLSSG